jgi:hypothetical protein
MLGGGQGLQPSDFDYYWSFNGDYTGLGISALDLTEQEINVSIDDYPITFVTDRNSVSNGAVHFANTLVASTGGCRLVATVDYYSGDITYSFWAKITSNVNNVSCPVELNYGDGLITRFHTYDRLLASSNSVVYSGAGIDTSILSSNYIDVWAHHLIRTTAAGVTDYFLNGVQVLDSVSLSAPTLENVALGWGTGGAPYNGAIDDLIIVKRFIDDEEISDFMNFNY